MKNDKLSNEEFKLLKLICGNIGYGLLICGYNAKLKSVIVATLDAILEEHTFLTIKRRNIMKYVTKWRKMNSLKTKNFKQNIRSTITPIINDKLFENLPKLREEIDKILLLSVFDKICDQIEERYNPNIDINMLGLLNQVDLNYKNNNG